MIKNNLKEIRMKEYMMNLTEFSKMLDIDLKVYSNWERNVSRPMLEVALLVSYKLNRNVNDIWSIDLNSK